MVSLGITTEDETCLDKFYDEWAETRAAAKAKQEALEDERLQKMADAQGRVGDVAPQIGGIETESASTQGATIAIIVIIAIVVVAGVVILIFQPNIIEKVCCCCKRNAKGN